ADVGEAAGDHRVALVHAVRGEDVALLSVRVVKERDACGAVGGVFDVRHLRGHADLVALEGDQPIPLLVAATPEARGDPPVVVSTTGARLRLQQLAQRLVGRDRLEIADRVEAATRRRRFGCADTHGYSSPSLKN